ncbi:outer membrane lipoprotein LolB [Pollutimonas harenae]|uniref:Outer-membrane lipoprotein LolB n=1 Tax=Pollutimonas harenae TaxID=657015 RepID=A0A853H6W0_9BURK|nr:outer membrane lipoprotein LolB [Pollutimonas harenae]NYT86885.1 outer membrane lipoprotein LolB [Pollutimonas harenae]TEA69400.1 outer membrane lipoprotein LolB [Pollutimonas harenae]
MMFMWLKRSRAWWCAGLLALLLTACATPQRIGMGSDTEAFDRTGRFALNVQNFGGQRDAVQGGFAWHDDGRMLILDLANPLGSILARVEVTPGKAVMTRSNGEQERAEHPDALVELVLGSPMPVAGLRDWLRGETGLDRAEEVQKNEAGQITEFRQSGWRVQLSRYDSQGPRLLQLNRNDSNRNISLRLVIDSQ